MHREAYEFVQGVVREMEPPKRVIEIGSYDVNGSVRDLFPESDYTGIDVRPGRGVDMVADGAEYLHPEPVEAVVCCEVLEHAPNAGEIIRNAWRLLDRHGVLIVTAAGTGRSPHGSDGGPVGGEFYRNVDQPVLETWLKDAGFSRYLIEQNWQAGDIYAVAYKDGVE